MKTKIKEFVCKIIFFVACLMILESTNYHYSYNDWQFWCIGLGIFGIYFVGRYEGKNGF